MTVFSTMLLLLVIEKRSPGEIGHVVNKCRSLLGTLLPVGHWQVGKSGTVFLKADAIELLVNSRAHVLATGVQKVWRACVARRRTARIKSAFRILLALFRIRRLRSKHKTTIHYRFFMYRWLLKVRCAKRRSLGAVHAFLIRLKNSYSANI